MTKSRLTDTACLDIMSFLMLGLCGCASMNATSERLSVSGKNRIQAKTADRNSEEVATTLGQKKRERKSVDMAAERNEPLGKTSETSQQNRTYAENIKAGNQQQKEGRMDAARRHYELALVAKPDDPEAHHRLAVVADRQGMFGMADDHYEAALRKCPRDPSLLSDFGYSHILRGDDQKAEETLLQAIALDPSHKPAMANLGTIYSKQARHEDAFLLFRKGTTEAEAQQYMSQLFPNIRQPEQALNAMESVTAVSKSEPPTAPHIPSDDRSSLGHLSTAELEAEVRRRTLERSPGLQQQFSQSSQNPTSSFGSPIQRDPRNNALSENQSLSLNASAISFQKGAQDLGQNMPSLPLRSTDRAGNFAKPFPENIPLENPPTTLSGDSRNQLAFQNQMTGSTSQPPIRIQTPVAPRSHLDYWDGVPVHPGGGSINAASLQNLEQIVSADKAGAAVASPRQAAAEWALNSGPGSMFPSVKSDASTVDGMYSAVTDRQIQDAPFAREFPHPSQYENPANLRVPNGHSSTEGASPEGSSHRPLTNNTPPQYSISNDIKIAPASPASNMSRPWETALNRQPSSQPIPQDAPSAWEQSTSRHVDTISSSSPESHSNENLLSAKDSWDEPSNQSTQSRPYNGTWPSNNAKPTNPAHVNGNPAIRSPLQNNRNNADDSVQIRKGDFGGNTSGSDPQPWSYSPSK